MKLFLKIYNAKSLKNNLKMLTWMKMISSFSLIKKPSHLNFQKSSFRRHITRQSFTFRTTTNTTHSIQQSRFFISNDVTKRQSFLLFGRVSHWGSQNCWIHRWLVDWIKQNTQIFKILGGEPRLCLPQLKALILPECNGIDHLMSDLQIATVNTTNDQLSQVSAHKLQKLLLDPKIWRIKLGTNNLQNI